jgi:hypothetical protein
MLHKQTFFSDTEVNQFFADNTDKNGESTVYLVKIIIVFNPLTRQQEQHYIYSEKSIMKSGQHLRKGVPQ